MEQREQRVSHTDGAKGARHTIHADGARLKYMERGSKTQTDEVKEENSNRWSEAARLKQMERGIKTQTDGAREQDVQLTQRG